MLTNKLQPETPSIRVSDRIRDRLQRARELGSNRCGRRASTSAVAKLYLEFFPHDHATIEAAELMVRPTESLLAIRCKWVYRQRLSRAEWMVIAYYVQQGTEQQSENPVLPRCRTLADLLEAFLAVRALRAHARPDLDGYYKANLLDADIGVMQESGSDALTRNVAEMAVDLREGHSKVRPLRAGRAFLLAVREEPLPGPDELSRSLVAYWPALYRLAARGHWLLEHRPLRDPDGGRYNLPATIPPSVSVVSSDYGLTVMPRDIDLCVAMQMSPQHVLYPLNSWPEICEFAAMADQLRGGQTWNGRYFLGYTYEQEPVGLQFAFRSRENGITVNFSKTEWGSIQRLWTAMFHKPELFPVFEAAVQAYGEI